jgi:hypothetical protein
MSVLVGRPPLLRRARPGRLHILERSLSKSASLASTQSPTERVTCAVPPMPMARAAALERSIVRPLTNGPRSLIRTKTDLPFNLFVTLTRVHVTRHGTVWLAYAPGPHILEAGGGAARQSCADALR